MRGRTALLTIIAVLPFAAAGCGGDQIAADEVTVEPPTLTIPKDTKLTTTTRADADADATPTPTETADAATGTSGTTAPSTGGTSGTTAPPAGGTTGGTTGGGTTTTAPPADTGGASADQDFDKFCANNPGAC
jgi:type II secretory pathway pseudopilin PulG